MVGSGRWIVAGGLPTCSRDHPNRAILASFCDVGGTDPSRGIVRNAGQSPITQKRMWNGACFAGSLMASLSQGFMLGMYIMGLTWTLPNVAFATLTAVFLTVGYSFIGAVWLIWKTENQMQRRAIRRAKSGIWGLVMGIVAISVATPFVSTRILTNGLACRKSSTSHHCQYYRVHWWLLSGGN